MVMKLTEGNIKFEFADGKWEVRSYDAEGGSYRRIERQLPTKTKAVDFVGILETDKVVYLVRSSDVPPKLHISVSFLPNTLQNDTSQPTPKPQR